MSGFGPLGSAPLGAVGSLSQVIIEVLATSGSAGDSVATGLARVLGDTADASELLASLLAKVAADRATAAAVLLATGNYLRALNDEAEANEALRAAFLGVLSDEADAASTLDTILAHYARLRDFVVATDSTLTSLDASRLLFSSAMAADMAANAFSAQLSDSSTASSLLLSSMTAMGQLIDSAEASVSQDNTLRVLGVLSDTAETSDSLSALAQLLGRLSSEASASVVLTLGGAEYTAWVLNTENIAVTQYTNYAFNSYAELGGQYYGAASDGIYLLQGDNDAGAAIQAYFRAPLTDYGIAELKRAPQFYFGYTSTGELLFKAVVVSPNGVKEEHWYKLEARPAAGLRETRTKVGKGLQSVYWQYELHNIDGADFNLDVVRIWPMVLTRRVR